MLALAVGACQTISDKRKIDYRQTQTLPPLEVPPDLATLPDALGPATAPGAATYSDFATDRRAAPAAGGVLPQFDNVRLAREGQTRYLVVKAPPELVWPRVREFVPTVGLLIDKEDPATGMIETDWAENRAKVGDTFQRALTRWLGSLYATGLRDKYRIRLERGAEPGTTEIYLTHQGMEEVVAVDTGTDIRTMWQPRESDPELEAELVRRLMVHLGATEDRAKSELARVAEPAPAPERARLARNGDQVSLNLEDDLDRAWRRVGLSLDRIGFTVEDRDRSRGIYYVRYIDPDKAGKKPGFFSRMFGGGEPMANQQYHIHLQDAGTGTRVEVLDKDGEPETSKTGERILSLLYEQLK
jgi:outer membrane protein assembly factor BamC